MRARTTGAPRQASPDAVGAGRPHRRTPAGERRSTVLSRRSAAYAPRGTIRPERPRAARGLRLADSRRTNRTRSPGAACARRDRSALMTVAIFV